MEKIEIKLKETKEMESFFDQRVKDFLGLAFNYAELEEYELKEFKLKVRMLLFDVYVQGMERERKN